MSYLMSIKRFAYRNIPSKYSVLISLSWPSFKRSALLLWHWLPMGSAITASYALPLIKAPVGRLRNWLDLLAYGVKFAAYLSACASYPVIRSALNNPITRHIAPSVPSLDSKVEHLCDTAGRYTGNALAFPVILSFYLIASAYALAVTLMTSVTRSFALTVALSTALINKETVGTSALLRDLRENFKSESIQKRTIDSALLIYRHYVKRSLPTIVLTITVALSSPFMALMSSVYAVSSLFRLDNRFNIYDYDANIGTVQKYIANRVHGHRATYDRLVSEATYDRLVSKATSSPQLEMSTFTPSYTCQPNSLLSSTVTSTTESLALAI